MQDPQTPIRSLSGHRRGYLIVVYTVIVLYATLFYAGLLTDFAPVSDNAEQISVTAEFLALGVMFCGVFFFMTPEERLPWKIFLCSTCCYICAETYWMIHVMEYGEDPSSPSLSDAFYIINSLMLILGVIAYLYVSGAFNVFRLSLDFAITLVAAFGIIYYFVLQPVLTDEHENTLALLISVFYPVADFCLFIGMMLMLFSRRSVPHPRDWLLGLCLLLAFTADESDLIEELYGLDLYVFSQPLWSLMIMALALATLQPPAFLPGETDASQEHSRNYPQQFRLLDYLRMMLPFVLTVSILTLSLLKYRLYESVFLWGMLLLLLLSLRQFVAIGHNRKLLFDMQRQDELLKDQNHELQRLNAQVLHDSRVDFLTELLNRRRIDELLTQELESRQASSASSTTAVMLIDVDFFKRINDTYGHQAGDEVLHGVAELLRAQLPQDSHAGRYGGDEFLVVLSRCSEEQVDALGAALVAAVHSCELLKHYQVTLSIGGACYPADAPSHQVSDQERVTQTPKEKLLKLADEALYEAKLKGRDRFMLYRPDTEAAQA
ncbi:MAG: GGDEF domain-containing protein [Succinivibrio sp.]|nr:GGDEF domain-containing protein [Succinivibrio sp.]